MKKGTNVGLDRNYNNVRVGDVVVMPDGAEFTINSYGMAVDAKGKSRKLADLKGCEVKKQPEQPAAEEHLPDTDLKALAEFGDKDLVAELRRRGWSVTCTKKVEKVVLKTVKI